MTIRLKAQRPNQWLRFDLEGNGLNELTIDKSKNIIKECSVIHCMWVQDLYDRSFKLYKGDSLREGAERLFAAECIRGHNILQYDVSVLERLTGVRRPQTCRIDDSLVRSRLLWLEPGSGPMGGSSLEEWGHWLGIRKGQFKGPWDKWSKEMEDYCKQDVVVHEAIDNCLAGIPQNEAVVRIEHKVGEIIARQTANGWCYDKEGGLKLIAELEIEKAGLLDQLRSVFPDKMETLKTPTHYEIRNNKAKVIAKAPTKGAAEKSLRDLCKKVGIKFKDTTATIVPGPMRTKLHPFNPDSGDQIADRLKERYKWKPTVFTDGGKPKTDYDVMSRLPYPEAKLLLKYGDNGKMLDYLLDYDKRVGASRDGKVHGSINVQGCVTGRMSHSQPNLGNVPKGEKDKEGKPLDDYWKIRRNFRARPGWVMVGGDASALEDRMRANRSGFYDPVEWELRKEDLHTVNMNILRTIVPECTRDNAKTFWYAWLYGARAKKQGSIFGKGADVGEKLDAKFKQGRPALAKLVAYCQRQAKEVGYLKLIDSRMVPCRSEHSALNTLLQGDGGVLMKVALIICDATLQKKYKPGLDYEFLGNIHDEFQMESRPEIAEEVGKTIVWSIAEAGRRLKVRVPLAGEYKVGASWAETH